MSELKIRKYQPGDENQIISLLQKNFPNTQSINDLKKTWKWQFIEKVPENPNIYVCEDNNRIIAQYAVIDVNINLHGKIKHGALSMGTVTDTSYRGKGLFPKLASLLYEDLAKRKYSIVYGFPNSQSIKGFIKKLNWTEISSFPLLLYPLKLQPFLEKKIKYQKAAKILGNITSITYKSFFSLLNLFGKMNYNFEISECENITEECGELWKSTHLKNRICLVRDKEYLTWRYKKIPFSDYKLYVISNNNKVEGYFITKNASFNNIKLLFIMEFIIKNDDKHSTKFAMNKIKEMARNSDVDGISLLSLFNNPLHFTFLKKGYIPVPSAFFPQEIHFGCLALNNDDLNNSEKKPGNWYISWGDLDVI